MLLSSLQPPLLERSLQFSKFHCHKDYMTTQRVANGCIAATRSAVAPRCTEEKNNFFAVLVPELARHNVLPLSPLVPVFDHMCIQRRRWCMVE